MANPKYEFFKTHANTKDLARQVWNEAELKYYNLWMSKFKINGLDEELSAAQNNFIFRKFWEQGKVAGYMIPEIGPSFAMFSDSKEALKYGMYDQVSEVRLINNRGVSTKLIPDKAMIVGKDVVVGYCKPDRSGVKKQVDYYISRIAEAEMVINTNLQLHKMPFILTVDGTEQKKKLDDVVQRILDNELIVYASNQELTNINVLALNTPYIIDKIQDYIRTKEMQLLTILGIDNNGDQRLMMTNITSDAVNANNDCINNFHRCYKQEIEKFIESMNRTFGLTLSLEDNAPKVQSIHNDINEGEQEDGKEEDQTVYSA